MNLDELIVASQSGSSEAFLTLRQKYQPVIYKMQKSYHLKDLEREDWLQEGDLVLYQSIKNYKKEKGLTLGCFFRMNFERRIFSLLRKQGALKRKAWVESLSFEQQFEKQGDFFLLSERELSYQFTTPIAAKEQIVEIVYHMSKFEKAVLYYYLLNKSESETATALDCSDAKVHNGMDRIKKKCKMIMP